MTGHMTGTITNLALVEATIDPTTFTSTLVAGGKCLAVGNITLDHTMVPNAWTCAAAAYNDGTTCDCMCGIPDPDCGIAAAPITGCTTGQVCTAAGMCATPPSNDTCQTATALTVGTPTTGTTVGAANNYSTGLDAATCTNVTQDGADVAYSVTLTAGTSYTFTLSNVDATFDPSLSLVGPGLPALCDVSPIGCLVGADVNTEGMGETFQYTPTATGTYYVIVDSFYGAAEGAESGAFTVEVTTP